MQVSPVEGERAKEEPSNVGGRAWGAVIRFSIIHSSTEHRSTRHQRGKNS